MTPLEIVLAVAGTVAGSAFTAGTVAVGITWRIGRELEQLKTQLAATTAQLEHVKRQQEEGTRLWLEINRTIGRALGILEGRSSTPGT